MKTTICFVLGLLLSNVTFAAESTKCSPENLEKLLNLSAKIVGELGNSSVKTTKLFSSGNFEKMNAKEIKAEYFKINETQSKKTMPVINEISAFIKAHPECDKNYNFSLKTE